MWRSKQCFLPLAGLQQRFAMVCAEPRDAAPRSVKRSYVGTIVVVMVVIMKTKVRLIDVFFAT